MEPFETKKASRFLSQFLDLDIRIGSKEFVNVRRLLKKVEGTTGAVSDGEVTMVFTGSKAEGFNFPCSDHDIMAVYNTVLVIQHLDEVLETDLSKYVLVMDNTDCRPGYTLLTPLHGCDNQRIRQLVEINGKQYLSSTLFMQHTLLDGCYIHGPCSTLPGITRDSDFASAFHCRSWPDTLTDFVSRTAHCVWPPSELVYKIVQDGFEFVAIGDKHSSLFEVQWRLSFVKAEVALVKSFNHVQFKTYGLLKIFLKECIERDDSVKDLLCSYFMKTILFHAIEHSQPTMWVDENIVECFWYCFTILLECVQTGFLPNYFILEHNLFLSNVIGNNRERLLRVLYGYQAMGWKCLFQCGSLHSLSQDIIQSVSEYPTPNRIKTRLIEINRDLLIATTHGYIDIYRSSQVLNLAIRVFRTYEDEYYHDIAVLFTNKGIARMSRNKISHLPCIHQSSNKAIYSQIRKHKRILHMSSNTDVCGGLLSLATFYYNIGCYHKVSEPACRVVHHCQQSAAIQLHRRGNYDGYFYRMCGKGYTLLQKARKSFTSIYTIHKKYNRLYPPELDLEVQNDNDMIDLPPLAYAIFLIILSTYRLGNAAQSQMVLGDLLDVRTNPIYGTAMHPIIHNMIGICHQLIGDSDLAVEAFEDSCQYYPSNLAANIRLTKLRQLQGTDSVSDGTNDLDYYNVKSQNVNIHNDEGREGKERRGGHLPSKTMYNMDPLSFMNMS
ncbi:uncharacterized protein [Argopecten irradians]|uniref:uncharacterized protein n=1 Tax=Argopecten irradians TaxID=31199 RepID=UPI003718EDE2